MSLDAHLGNKDFDRYQSNIIDSDTSTKVISRTLNPYTQKYLCQIISKTPTKSAFSQSLIGRVLIWLGTPILAAIRLLFPSASEILDKRVANLSQALTKRLKPQEIKSALGESNKIGHDELKDVLNAWLFSTLGDSIKKPPYDQLLKLVNDLADGDVTDDIREKMKTEAQKIVQDPTVKEQFPQLRLAVTSFIQLFDEEHKEEASIKALPTEEFLKTLLMHSNLLKRKEVGDVVKAMPESSLRQKVLDKMHKVQSHVLMKAQEKETEVLKDLPHLLQELKMDDLKQKYSSLSERTYIQERCEVVEDKIFDNNVLLHGKEDFNLKVLKFEKGHLEKQIAAMDAAQKTLDRIGAIPQNAAPESTPPILEDANKISSEELVKIRAMQTDRADSSLKILSQSISEQDPQIKSQLDALMKEFEALKKLDNKEYLENVLSFTRKLQHLEYFLFTKLPNAYGYLSDVNHSMDVYGRIKSHLDKLHELTTPWKDIAEIKTYNERQLERQNGLAKDVIRLSLEKIGACQLPLRLAKMDARRYDPNQTETEESSTLDAKLKKHATEFIENVQTKQLEYVKTRLFSLREYTSDVDQQHNYKELIPVMGEVSMIESPRFNFEQFALGLDISEPLQQWQSDLQQIWAEHIPREQEREILSISDQKKRTQKMEECFNTWLWAKTNTKLIGILSFEGVKIEDQTAIRKAQIAKISPSLLASHKLTAIKSKSGELFKPAPKAVNVSLIEQAPPDFALQNISLGMTEYQDINAGSIAISNPVKKLQQARVKIFGDPPKPITPELREKWIKELVRNPQLHSLVDLRLTILNEFQVLAKECFDKKKLVPSDLQEIFLNQYRFGKEKNYSLDFSQLNNLELKNFLDTYLKIAFAGNAFYIINNEQHNYLMQFCSLSGLSVDQINEIRKKTGVNNNARSTLRLQELFSEVGSKLQESYIGLEGVEESVLQKSFVISNLPKLPETRKLLDTWRARSGSALLPNLFRFSIDNQNKSHYEGRDAIARAIYHAFKDNPVQGEEYLTELLLDPSINNDQFNTETLAPPLRIFYLDCLLNCSSKNQMALSEIQKFNETLIQSNDVNQMVMGFSREIVRLSSQLTQDTISEKDFAKLLKYKLAYQELKQTHFKNKIEIGGFLKVATEAADIAMVDTAPAIQKKISDSGYLQTIRPLLLENVFEKERYADKLLKDLFKDKMEVPLVMDTYLPGYFSIGERIQIDAALGVLYYDGNLKVSLPANLQNHSDLRSLGIHSLPFAQEVPGGPFVYYATVNGSKMPQITVTEVDDKPIIHRRLPVYFDITNSISQLQYVPKEQLSLPYAIAHRMDIKNFWTDESGIIYGYNSKGDLSLILERKTVPETSKAPSREEWIVKLKDNKYYTILTAESMRTNQSHPVLKRLISSVNPNEILVNWEKESFYIPSLGMTLVKTGDKEPNWKCECKGITGKVLDFDVTPSTFIHLKNEMSQSKTEQINKELALAKQNFEKENKPGLSRVDKQKVYKLEREITRLENALSEAEGRVVLKTLPEDAFDKTNTALIHLVNDLVPEKYQTKISAALYDARIQFGFEAYSKVLELLNTEYYIISSSSNRTDEEEDELFALQNAYKAIRDDSEKVLDRSAERVLFKTYPDGKVMSLDLSGALTLALNDKENPIKLIKELAKYSSTQHLTESQIKLLKEASKVANERYLSNKDPNALQLQAYLQLLSYQHLTNQLEELAHSTLSDKKAKVESIQKEFIANKTESETLLKGLTSASPELVALWKKVSILPEKLAELNPVAPTAIPMTQEGKSIVGQEFVTLSQQSLLERFQATDKVTSTAKDTQQELSPQHKALIKSYQSHTPEQVEGFYLEEMGRFNLNGLNNEFRLNDQTKKGLYGIEGQDLKNIFSFLQKEGYISQKGQDNYFSLMSPDYATKLFHRDQLRAFLADRPYSEEQIQKIIDRVQGFLFRAMQSGFKFSFVDNKAEVELTQKLENEKATHLEKYLDAEATLKSKIAPYGIPLVDLKYAVLSGDYRKLGSIPKDDLPVLRNALMRYLFHKTELQHIDNILNAPTVGERNKIELLQTKRNYSVDKLLQEGLTGQDRIEQIMQRAFLLFEEDYGFRCNSMQIKMFRSLLLDSKDEEAIDAAQARMGFGKTALLPIMAIVRLAIERVLEEEDKHLVEYVVPRAVLEDNTSSFNQRLYAVTGGNVVKDREFSRYQIDKNDPISSFEFIKTDLQNRLAFYKEVKKSGDALIKWPEIRGSMEAQDLDFGEMIDKGNLSGELLDKCIECKRLLGEIRSISTYTVYDELDDTQDIKSREVNYTRGEKSPIEVSSIRPTEKLIAFVESQENWKDTKAVARKMLAEVVGIDESTITNSLVDYVTDRNLQIDEKILPFLSEPLRDFVMGKSPSKIHTEQDAALFLVRALLLDHNMLALTKSKQPNTHFGVRFAEKEGKRVYFHDPDSQSALLIAVPYEGTNTPKGLSIFDNTEVASITTMRYYLSKETQFTIEPHLDFLVKQIKRNSIPQELSSYYLKNMENSEGQNPFEALKEISGMLDEEELKKAKELFYKEFMSNPTQEFRKFFGMAVVATQIRSDAGSAKSDRYEKGSLNSVVKGCSGTVGGTSSYFSKQEIDAAADGKLSLEIMGRTNNAEVKKLSPPEANQDYLEGILSTLLANCNENTRALIDAAGMCKSRDGTPETIVARLWDQLQKHQQIKGIEGIVYYGKDNVKRLYRGPNLPAISCNTAMELAALNGKKYFSFYGQKNTRGSDVKQANGVHGLVTMDENVLNSDAKQAVLRFRNLVNRDSGQTFSFAIMPGYEKIIKEGLKNESLTQIENAKKEITSIDAELISLKQTPPTSPMTQNEFKEYNDKIKLLGDSISALNTQINTLQNRVTSIDQIKIEAKEISNYLRLKEKEIEEQEGLIIFRKEMSAHVKQAAFHLEQNILSQLPKPLTDGQKTAYKEFLKERNKISAFIELNLDNLYSKYGTATRDQSRDDFIKAQKELALQKLGDLFRVANKFADTTQVKVKLSDTVYIGEIDKSAKLFEKRFNEKTPVQVASVNSGATAIAQALAEAFAQAEAESLAEKLSESIVAVQERYEPPKLVMSTENKPEVSLAFLERAELRHAAKETPFLKKLIKPSLINKFQSSDFLLKQNIVSHFVLAKEGSPYIFIAQEEADLFKQQVVSNNNQSGYALYDARTLTGIPDVNQKLDGDKDEVKQIMCAILGDNLIPKTGVDKVEQLRATSLTNVDSEQLMPHLQVKTDNATLLKTYIGLDQFGVKNNTSFDLKVSQSALVNAIEINLESGTFKSTLSIPQNNKFLNKHISNVYNDNGIHGKMQEVEKRVKQEYGSLAEKLESLEKQKKLLEVQKAILNQLLSDPEIGNFNATPVMEGGLKSRDLELLRRAEDPQFLNLKESYTAQSTYGVEFLKTLNEIVNARENFKQNPSIDNLKKLENAFYDFVNPSIIEKMKSNGFDYNTTPLITSEDWYRLQEGDKSINFKPLELVYGRILYYAHLGDLQDAIGCYRKDCKHMFSETLPKLIESINKLTNAIKEIEQIEQKTLELTSAIEEINKQIPTGLIEADETMKAIIKEQTRIETELTSKGIRFAEKDQLFDRFNFQNFGAWTESVKATISSVLPDYKNVVSEGIDKGYSTTIAALTKAEQDVANDNKSFLKNVLNLSAQVAPRATELVYT